MSRNRSVAGSMVAGAIGGSAGSWVMNRLMRLEKEASSDAPSVPPISPQEGKRDTRSSPITDTTESDPTVAIGARILKWPARRPLTKEEKRNAGTFVHYLFGASVGATYGALAHYYPAVTLGKGAPFGAAVWLAADEVALPLLSLTKPPTRVTWRRQLVMLGLHLAYGVVTEGFRRRLMKVSESEPIPSRAATASKWARAIARRKGSGSPSR